MAAMPQVCQVPACEAPLADAKPYHRKHRVCAKCAKADFVAMVDGSNQRFCQQCSRFHPLSEFKQNKRSCDKTLRQHCERRMKRYYRRKEEQKALEERAQQQLSIIQHMASSGHLPPVIAHLASSGQLPLLADGASAAAPMPSSGSSMDVSLRGIGVPSPGSSLDASMRASLKAQPPRHQSAAPAMLLATWPSLLQQHFDAPGGSTAAQMSLDDAIAQQRAHLAIVDGKAPATPAMPQPHPKPLEVPHPISAPSEATTLPPDVPPAFASLGSFHMSDLLPENDTDSRAIADWLDNRAPLPDHLVLQSPTKLEASAASAFRRVYSQSQYTGAPPPPACAGPIVSEAATTSTQVAPTPPAETLGESISRLLSGNFQKMLIGLSGGSKDSQDSQDSQDRKEAPTKPLRQSSWLRWTERNRAKGRENGDA